MNTNRAFLIKCGFFATFCFVVGANATTPFSQYGMIQNVQDYSSNPLYNPGTSTITSPHVIYNTGPSLKADDCQRVVTAVVESVCSQRNNCKNASLSDVRPYMMIQLSRLPGYNYTTACSGYIDDAFDKYTKNNKTGISVNTSTAFPTAMPTATTNKPVAKSDGYAERAAELKELQEQTKTGTDNIYATSFPKTFDDLSFAEKNALKQADYEKYKDAQVYVPIDVKPDKTRDQLICDAATPVVVCLQRYDTAEKTAEKNFFNAYKAWLADKSADNKTSKDAAADALKSAIADAIYAICKCTDGGSRFNSTIRGWFGESCPQDAETNAKAEAKSYVDSLIGSLPTS